MLSEAEEWFGLVNDFIQIHQKRFIRELIEFIRTPSVSAQPNHKRNIHKCAHQLAKFLFDAGVENVKVTETKGNPIVVGNWLHAKNLPTVLFYGHYDVQPAELEDGWQSPPFEPVIRNGSVFGRGSCDDKGQLFVHIKAVESLLRTRSTLPVNVKFLYEGEEEIGSPSLSQFLDGSPDCAFADSAVISDTVMLGPDQPVITESLRGSLSVELNLSGADGDLHSGNFGGAIHNPVQVLCEIVASLHDNDGRIAIPHFYNSVLTVPEVERRYMRNFGPTDADVLLGAGSMQGWGEPGFTLYERTTIRPSLTITGLSGGYGGVGIKSIIPSEASAKLNLRTVPDQTPSEVYKSLYRHLMQKTPPRMHLKMKVLASSNPSNTKRTHFASQAALTALQHGFGVNPTFLRSGGTIPVASMLQEKFNIHTVLMGFALPDAGLHGPNEHMHLPTFFKGITTIAAFLTEFGKKSPYRIATQNPENSAFENVCHDH